jgi:hypothetical protein
MSRTRKRYLQSSLYRWTRTLPAQLRVAPNDHLSNTYFPNTLNFAARQLYLPFFTGLIMFSRMQTGAGSVSLAATLAASFVARLFEDFLARDEVKVLAPIFTRHSLIAGMALVSLMPHRSLWEAAQPDLQVLQQALSELSKRWRSAIGASRALANAIGKRQRGLTFPTGTLHIEDEDALELFQMIDLNYCRMWTSLNQQLSAVSSGDEKLTGLGFDPMAQHVSDPEPFLGRGHDDGLALGAMQFQHVEDWILNDSYLFEV